MANQIKESKGSSKKPWLMWGLPLIVLVVLIVLLAMELTNEEQTSVESPERVVTVVELEEAAPVVMQELEPIEEPQLPLRNEVEVSVVEETTLATADIEEMEEAEETLVEVEMEMEATEEALPVNIPMTAEEAEEAENSYIVEEGDSLWKIAQKTKGDAWKWKTILIHNKDQINYTIVSEETGEWKVMVDTGKRLVLKSEESGKKELSFDRTRKKRYAIQLMSLNIDQLESAIDTVKFLIQDGYYAYLYRTPEKIKGQYFYRIRVGFFKTEGEALATGEEIYERYLSRKVFTTDYWAVLPSYRELGGELIDFGIQRNKPWIIQLNEQISRRDAIETLKSVSSLAEFSYISQKRNEAGGFLYRTRVGFFETERAASKVLDKIKDQADGLFANAEIMEVRHIMEAAPGQATGVSNTRTLER